MIDDVMSVLMRLRHNSHEMALSLLLMTFQYTFEGLSNLIHDVSKC